jgi:hypothetical protein
MIRGGKATRVISLGLAILPALILAFLILKYSVNVPFWDQWGDPGFIFEKIQNGTLSFKDFFAQLNESRPFFPRFIFIGLAHLTKWDVRYEMLLIFLLACIVSFNIYRLSCLTLNNSPKTNLLILFFANLLIFVPLEWGNWFMGIQIIVFVPIICITTCLCLTFLPYGMWLKLLICCCLSVISTFSYANGMLCWVMFLPALVLSSSWKGFRNKSQLLITWLVTFALNQYIYFYDYVKPGYHPSLAFTLGHPKEALIYFFAFLGSPLSGSNLIIAYSVGFLVFVLFISLSTYLFWRVRQESSLLHRMSSWLILGAYSLLSAVITTLGRVGFGVEQALSTRYIVFSVFLTVAIIYLTVIVADDLKSQNWFGTDTTSPTKNQYALNIRKYLSPILASLMTALVVLHLISSVHALQAIQVLQRDRLYAKSCLIFFRYVSDDCIALNLFPAVGVFRERVPLIDSLGLLEPNLAISPEIRQAESRYIKNQPYGWFDQFKKISDNQYFASGWAILPDKTQPADSVLLTYKDSQGKSIFFGLSPVKIARADIVKILKQDNYMNSGWSAAVSTQGLPNGKVEINAWAFDVNTGEAFQLGGSQVIQHNTP